MTKPEALKPGAKVALVATARKVTKEDLNPAVNLLKKNGLQPVYGQSIGLSHHQFAGTDQKRVLDLQAQLDDPEIKAIWCVKGGYGTVRILDALDFTSFIKNPKWIVGYSDVTALHSTVHNLGMCSVHGQMATAIETRSEKTRETLFQILKGKLPEYHWAPQPLNTLGTTRGQLIGGNLSVLYSLCGSPSSIDTNGKILFLEDLDEYLYHVDRMMQNLKRNGMLSGLEGLIIGGMTDMNDNNVPFGKTAEEIISETIKEYDFPVSFGFPAGHKFENHSFILGQQVELTVGSQGAKLNYR